jgi:hypothetical protein
MNRYTPSWWAVTCLIVSGSSMQAAPARLTDVKPGLQRLTRAAGSFHNVLVPSRTLA